MESRRKTRKKKNGKKISELICNAQHVYLTWIKNGWNGRTKLWEKIKGSDTKYQSQVFWKKVFHNRLHFSVFIKSNEKKKSNVFFFFATDMHIAVWRFVSIACVIMMYMFYVKNFAHYVHWNNKEYQTFKVVFACSSVVSHFVRFVFCWTIRFKCLQYSLSFSADLWPILAAIGLPSLFQWR